MTKVAVIYSGARHWGGIETYILHLFETVPKDFEITLVSLGKWELAEKIAEAGGQVRYFSGARFRLKTIFEITSFLKKKNFSVISASGAVASAYGRAVSCVSGLPIVVTLHSIPEYDYPNKLYSLFHVFAARISRWRTSRYIVVSNYLKEQLLKEGVPSKKISVVYNGVPDIGVREKKPGSEVVLGSMGRLHFAKGYQNLIGALVELDKSEVQLKIWGEGEERESLLNLVQSLGLGDRVSFEGFSSDPAGMLSEIDIYVQPSLSEGFGISVVEAMLAQKPVVVTAAGSLPELIENGKTGLVADGTSPEVLAAAITKQLNDPKSAETMAKASRAAALKRFNLQDFSSKTYSVFKEVTK